LAAMHPKKTFKKLTNLAQDCRLKHGVKLVISRKIKRTLFCASEKMRDQLFENIQSIIKEYFP
jgi:hypothetical protein